MKFLRFLLVIFLLLVFAGLGAVFFQNAIISHLTKTQKSEFLNARYSIKTNELFFDDFVVNGKRLGKGRAKVELHRKGIMGLAPEIRLSEMKLENLDLNAVYAAPDILIDGFMEKIDIPADKEEAVKTTEEFISDTEKQINALNSNINEFVNGKLKAGIETVNKIKEDYNSLTNLKSKAAKLSELNKEAVPLIKTINEEKEKIEYGISDIEANRNIMLTNISGELVKLENIVSLNDVQNINSYIFLDKGKEVVQSLNQSMKIVMLIDEIKSLPIDISDISINGSKVNMSGLTGGAGSLTGEILLDNNVKVNVAGTENGYSLNYAAPDLSIKSSLEAGKKINSEITYSKNGILEGRKVDLISDLTYENGNFRNENKTVLTEEEKVQLSEKIKTLEATRYDEIMNQYTAQTAKIDGLIAEIYNKTANLDKVRKEMLVLNTTIKLDEILGIPSQSEQGAAEGENAAQGQGTQNNEQNSGEAGTQNNSTSNSGQTGAQASPQQQMKDMVNKITDRK